MKRFLIFLLLFITCGGEGSTSEVRESTEEETSTTTVEDTKTNTEKTDAAKSVFYAIETGILDGWTAAVAVEQCELVRLRNTQTAREKLDAFLSKG